MPKSRAPSKPARPSPQPVVNPETAGELPLPHERDETPEIRPDAKTRPQPEVAQALKDVREGQVDTDNYTRARDVARAGAKRK